MAVMYYLVNNDLPNLRGTMRAVTLGGRSFNLDDLIDTMLSRGSTLTRGEILAALEEFFSSIETFLMRGCAVKTPLFYIFPVIAGVFHDENDRFDPLRHRVKWKIRPGIRLKHMAANIAVAKIAGQRTTPVVLHFYDLTTAKTDSIATIGGFAKIRGRLLKFDENDTRQGVFFVNATNASVIWVGGKFLKNKGGELIFQLPRDIPVGLYRVEVRTVYKGNKRVRAGVLSVELTVRQ